MPSSKAQLKERAMINTPASTGGRPKLYNYYRSSASYRVRIALELKGIEYEYVPVHLRRDGGEHHHVEYLDLNPQGLVPMLAHDGIEIPQSLAIIDYLDRRFPEPPLIPTDPAQRAWALSVSQLIACEIHPLNNLRVLNYFQEECGWNEQARHVWYSHWIQEGFAVLERMLTHPRARTGRYCLGDWPTLADVYLVPQVYNARRFNVSIDEFPMIADIEASCLKLEAFQRAAPEAQPDAGS
jgi:maleylacetoacetate isomerase